MTVFDIVQKIIDMSIEATVVILVVLLVRGLVMRRFPKKYVYLLWIIVGIRLMCPVALNSSVSLFNIDVLEHPELLLPAKEGYAELAYEYSYSVIEPDSEIEKVTTEKQTKKTKVEDEKKPVTENAKEFTLKGTVPPVDETFAKENQKAEEISKARWKLPIRIWLAGMTLLLAWNLCQTLRWKKHLRKAVKYKDNIYECDDIASPFVMGVFRPRIYIPFRLREDEREYIIKHEQYHLRRKDNIVKILAVFLTTVYWFHPLVWVSYFLMVRDMEMSCDEQVLTAMEVDVRKEYSETLLAFATNKRRFAMGILSFGESDAKRRIKHILQFKKRGKKIGVFAIVLVVIVAVVGLTDAKDASGETAVVNDNELLHYDKGQLTTEIRIKAALQETMPKEVVRELNCCRWMQISYDEDSSEYHVKNSDKEAEVTLHFDFVYDKGALEKYVSREYGFVNAMPENAITEKEALALVQKFAKEFCEKELSKEHIKPVDTLDSYESNEGQYAIFEDYTGASYVVRLDRSMVVRYESSEKKGKDDKCVQINYTRVTDAFENSHYIPEFAEQEKLQQLAKELNPLHKTTAAVHKNWLQEQELGFSLVYEDNCWSVFSGGYVKLEYGKDAGDGIVVMHLPKLCKLAENICKNQLDYEVVNLTEIENLIEAKMVYQERNGENKKICQLADAKQLADLAKMLSGGSYIQGGSACPFGEVVLTLKPQVGEDIVITIAKDDCNIFRINGVYYEWDDSNFNTKLREMFPDIPWHTVN